MYLSCFSFKMHNFSLNFKCKTTAQHYSLFVHLNCKYNYNKITLLITNLKNKIIVNTTNELTRHWTLGLTTLYSNMISCAQYLEWRHDCNGKYEK